MSEKDRDRKLKAQIRVENDLRFPKASSSASFIKADAVPRYRGAHRSGGVEQLERSKDVEQPIIHRSGREISFAVFLLLKIRI